MPLLQRITPFSGVVAVRSKWDRIAEQAASLSDDFVELEDNALRKESLALKYEVLSGAPLDSIAARGFALVREAAYRHLGMRHYPVQLLGGAAMLDGAIAVMQTGEGKTLAATLPLYLAALANKGAHLATANDYLAARDAALMKPVFQALGLSTGVVEQSTSREDRASAYACDVTYSTAKEIGFDFLRDRLQSREWEETGFFRGGSPSQQTTTEKGTVQRDFHFMLVDEADSILIDEARTPLVISSIPDDEQERRALHQWSAQVTENFQVKTHFEFDEETGVLNLTPSGRTVARKLGKPALLAKTALADIYEQLEMALLINQKFFRDRHYVVRHGEVVIVDEFTGRMAEGRKWRSGLHQAIEAREGVEVTSETAEAARITIQDLFLKYPLLAGMTGTVASSARELKSIYGTPCVTIPTNKPPCREQWPDLVFGTADAKWQAMVKEVGEHHQAGRPVLVGTRSIDKSETLSALLLDSGIAHHVLNARYLEQEAEIVAQAGGYGQVTVATNMAGRGTDIRLSPEALAVGGMHVIISELHESERVDRQLIGRCGRQGDPGSYRSYMSLEDEILLLGLGASESQRLQRMGAENAQVSSHLARLFRKAQSRVEASHFRGRKMLLFQERQRQESQREMGQDPYVDTLS